MSAVIIVMIMAVTIVTVMIMFSVVIVVTMFNVVGHNCDDNVVSVMEGQF